MQREASTADVFRSHVDLLLLAIVEREPAHGYRIVEALRERSRDAFDLGEGTVYPALHRLEREGLLQSRWQTVEGRRRRVYRLTGGGKRALARRRDEWTAFAAAMRAVIA
jgi:PadR family transcriptional regulator PadR